MPGNPLLEAYLARRTPVLGRKNYVYLLTLEEKDGLQLLKLMDRLEELDDVQKVYANFDIPEEILAAR
mgnify:CR=1 FL=1